MSINQPSKGCEVELAELLAGEGIIFESQDTEAWELDEPSPEEMEGKNPQAVVAQHIAREIGFQIKHSGNRIGVIKVSSNLHRRLVSPHQFILAFVKWDYGTPFDTVRYLPDDHKIFWCAVGQT